MLLKNYYHNVPLSGLPSYYI